MESLDSYRSKDRLMKGGNDGTVPRLESDSH